MEQTVEDLERIITAMEDLEHARFCAEHLLEKGWYSPWRMEVIGYENSKHLTAYTTSMVVSYGRPYTASKGHPRLPKRFTPRGSSTWRRLHGRMLDARHETYAHSDSRHSRVTVTNGAPALSYAKTLPQFSRDDLEELCSLIHGTRNQMAAEVFGSAMLAPSAVVPSGSQP